MIDSEYIKTYCLDKFKANYRLSGDETELVIPSVFIGDDHKRHMSINLETGLWRCFKSGEKGNFIKLFSIVEKVSYRQAYERFLFESFMGDPPKKKVEPESKIEDTSGFIPLDVSEDYDDILMQKACIYAIDRQIQNYPLMVAKEGFYGGRLIIPYINTRNQIYYFQARALNGQEPKYLNCKSIKSSNILYPFDYDSYEPLFITEGVIDALSIKSCGLNATTTLSCIVSDSQMGQLKFYRGPIIVAYDNDRAGRDGASKFLRVALKHKIEPRALFYTFPKEPFKDWNEVLISKGSSDIKAYLFERSKELNHLNLLTSGL